MYRVSVSQGAASDSARLYVVRPSAHEGSRGIGVRALQRRLKDLGYLTPVSGHYGGSTGRAVLAFRKVNGFARTTSAGRAVFRRLARGGGGFKVRYPKAGKHAEFDWSRQVLVLARGSRPQLILHTSSGAPSTPTVFGKYRFYRKQPGYNAKGMYYSSYFVGGYAIHGYSPGADLPGQPRLPADPDREREARLRLGQPRRPDLHLPLGRSATAQLAARTSSIAIVTIVIAAHAAGRPGPRGIAPRRVGILKPSKSR